MKVLKRNDILIIDSNLKEEIPKWSEKASYEKDDEVLFDKYIYKALSQNVGTKTSDETKWEKMRVSNEWACFDYYLNTVSKAQSRFDLSFHCSHVQAIYIHGLKTRYLKIEVLDANTGEVLEDVEYDFLEVGVRSWLEYFFGAWQKDIRARNIYYELKILARSYVIRIRAWGVDEIECGSIICGELKHLALSLYDKNSISMIDFSKVMTDEDGNTQLTRGNFKRTNAFEMLVEDEDLDYVAYELTQLRGEACVFVISDYY